MEDQPVPTDNNARLASPLGHRRLSLEGTCLCLLKKDEYNDVRAGHDLGVFSPLVQGLPR